MTRFVEFDEAEVDKPYLERLAKLKDSMGKSPRQLKAEREQSAALQELDSVLREL